MQEHGQVIVFLITLVIFVSVMALVFTRRITERFAVLWAVISFSLLFASSFGFRFLFQIARFVGIPYPPSALFLIAISGLTLLVIELFVWISMLNERSRVLAQQVALLWDCLERAESGEGSRRTDLGNGGSGASRVTL
jgi:hypothetical protein